MDILVIHCIRLQISSCRVQMTRYVAVCKVMARNIIHVLLANCLFLQMGVCRCIGPILYWIQECLWRIMLMLMFYFFLSVKGLGKARQGKARCAAVCESFTWICTLFWYPLYVCICTCSRFQVACPIAEKRKFKLTNQIQAILKYNRVWRIWLIN